MRILADEKLKSVQLEKQELFFVELWYGMTHMRSLDSHRVRCLNARICVRELAEELAIGLLNPSELTGMCQEAKEILQSDPVIHAVFPAHMSVLLPFLDSPPSPTQAKKDKEQEHRAAFDRFRFAVADLSTVLDKRYFAELCEFIPKAVKPDNEKEIVLVTGSLLSDLIDSGWHLETLFSWTDHFLVLEKKGKKYTFAENLAFMLSVFRKPAMEYEVILRVFGSEKLVELRNHEGFGFTNAAEIEPQTKIERKWAMSRTKVVFANVKVPAFDSLSAVMNAREEFDDLVDLLRFGFEEDALQLDKHSFVRRLQGGKRELTFFKYGVPNPLDNTEEADFRRLVKDVAELEKSGRIEANSLRLLQAAIRHYRFGRDNESHRDKFLNWWLGLESLAYVNRGRDIGETVTHHISRLMLLDYLRRRLRDLQATLRFVRSPWPEAVAQITGCATIDDLSVAQLVTLLQSDKASEVWAGIQKHPIIPYRGGVLSGILCDANKTADLLECHRRHLEWHLMRLYRIRCCIVHGSPVRFRMILPTSNLEFYLKQSIVLLLEAFRSHEHIGSLSEAFTRANARYEHLITALRDKTANIDSVRDVAYADLVITERPV